MERDNFVFFRSWLDGVRLIKNKSARCDAYEAIINYALDGTEADTEQLATEAAIAYVMAKPVVDSGRKKAEAGRKGGEANPKQTESKREANGKQTEANPKQTEANPKQTEANGKQTPSNKNKNKNRKEEEKEEKEEKTPPPSYEGGGGKKNPPPPRSPAAIAYMEKVSATPSTVSMAELLEFERELGSDVCLRAIDEALDANARSWKYIRAILQDKKDRGITSLEAWDQMEAQRQDSRNRRRKGEAEPTFDSGDIDWMFEGGSETNGTV